MKHYSLLVIGSVLIMVASMLLVYDDFNQSQAQDQKLEENEIQEKKEQKSKEEKIKEKEIKENKKNEIKNIKDMSIYEILGYISQRISENQEQKQFDYKKLMNYINTYHNLESLLNNKGKSIRQSFDYNFEQDFQISNYSAALDHSEAKISKKESRVKKIKVYIPRGMISSRISAKLYEKKLIKDKEKFIDLLLKLGIDKKMRAGNFNFSSEDTAVEVLLKMTVP